VLRPLRALMLLAAMPLLAPAQKLFPPFRIIGNVYYVGETDLTSYLIVTPQGNILINTGFDFSVPEIRERIKTLGFKFSDIKILLVTHAHSDHAGGMATMKKLTGARMLAEEEEATLLDTGGKTDFLFGSAGWFNPVKVDGTFKDREKISLGGTDLTAYWMPGHTKGSTSYGLDVTENGKTYHVLIANLANINPGTALLHNPKYPKIAEDFERTFRVQKEVPCDVFLSSHAGQFGLLRKWHPGLPYDPERFVDPEGYLRAVERSEARSREQLQEERDEEKAWHDHLQFKDVNPQQP